MRLLVGLGSALLISVTAAFTAAPAEIDVVQPVVKASAAWVQAPESGATETKAFLVVDNGTMYDVYLVGVETDAATATELRNTPPGAASPELVKEVPVPAYGGLEMSPTGVHLHLKSLKRPLAAGDLVKFVIFTDGGEQLTISAPVK